MRAWDMKDAEFGDLVGQVVLGVERGTQEDGDDYLQFTTVENDVISEYMMFHYQDCCEHVIIEDIDNDIQKLVGGEILTAEVSQSNDFRDNDDDWMDDSNTWTFYKLATDRGHYVTIRWWGSSNGYYSESVDFMKM